MTEKSLTMTIVANRLTGEAIATAADCKGSDDVLGVTWLRHNRRGLRR
jgi:hypothetical protein